jgi:ribosomal-protein-alanine N-acetyltransferase
MIRNATINDIKRIDEIGSLIKEDFVNKYDISSFLNYEYSKLYVYEEEKVIGFIQLEEHYEIIDLINIAVDEEYHGKNIGTKLIEYALSNTNAEKMMLEVRESNISAIKLYEKVGFKEINRRKKYYGNEDAIIMERII